MKDTFKMIAIWAALAVGLVVLPPMVTASLMVATHPVIGAWSWATKATVLLFSYMAEVIITTVVFTNEAY